MRPEGPRRMPKDTGTETHHLTDRPDCIPTLAKWFEKEWAPWYGPDGQGNAEADLLTCCNRDALPLALVAVNNNGSVMGTAALKLESLGSELGYAPWLAAVLVCRHFRRQGVGDTLIGAIEIEARRLGFEKIYVTTDTADTLVSRRKWRPTGDRLESLRGQVRVYSLNLSDTPS